MGRKHNTTSAILKSLAVFAGLIAAAWGIGAIARSAATEEDVVRVLGEEAAKGHVRLTEDLDPEVRSPISGFVPETVRVAEFLIPQAEHDAPRTFCAQTEAGARIVMGTPVFAAEARGRPPLTLAEVTMSFASDSGLSVLWLCQEHGKP